MGEVIRYVSKPELERTRLVREARAIYESIFPSTDATDEQADIRLRERIGPVAAKSD